MAEIKSFSGEVANAWGKELPEPVKFSGTYEHLTSVDEIPDDEKLGPADILQVVNAKRKAAERARATLAALDAAGHKKPDPNSVEVMQENMIKTTMKLYGVTEEVAKQILAAAASAAAGFAKSA